MGRLGILTTLVIASLILACHHEVAPKTDEKSDQSEMNPELTLKPVYKSVDETPLWAKDKPGIIENGLRAVGKGSSVQDVLKAYHIALRDAATRIIRYRFGKDIRVEPNVEWRSNDTGLEMKLRPVFWLGEDRVEAGKIAADGAYYEIWESEGQKVYTAWVRIVWSEEEIDHIKRDHSI